MSAEFSEGYIVCHCTDPSNKKKVNRRTPYLSLPNTMNKDLKPILIGLILLCHTMSVSARPHSYRDGAQSQGLAALTDEEVLKCLLSPECSIDTVIKSTTERPHLSRQQQAKELADLLTMTEARLSQQEPESSQNEPLIAEYRLNTNNKNRERSQARSILSSLSRYGGSIHHGPLKSVSFNKRVADERSDKGFFQEW